MAVTEQFVFDKCGTWYWKVPQLYDFTKLNNNSCFQKELSQAQSTAHERVTVLCKRSEPTYFAEK